MTTPDAATPIGRFAADLQALKVKSGLTLAVISSRSDISVPTLSKAFNGRNLPSWQTVSGIVEACGGSIRQWRGRYETCGAATARRPLDEDWLLAEAVRSWTPSRAWTPTIVPQNLDEYRLWLRVAKRRSNRSFRQLSALSGVGPAGHWSSEAFSALVSGRRAFRPRCVPAFLTACGIVRRPDLHRWMSLLVNPARYDPGMVAEVIAVRRSLDPSRSLLAQPADQGRHAGTLLRLGLPGPTSAGPGQPAAPPNGALTAKPTARCSTSSPQTSHTTALCHDTQQHVHRPLPDDVRNR